MIIEPEGCEYEGLPAAGTEDATLDEIERELWHLGSAGLRKQNRLCCY